MAYFSWHKEQEPNVVHLQRKQHVLEKEMQQQRKEKEVQQQRNQKEELQQRNQKEGQQQENVLELQRENARTHSLFLKLTEHKNFMVFNLCNNDATKNVPRKLRYSL